MLKQDGSIKGPTCVDGRGQRGKYTKEQTASPVVLINFIMLILIATAIKGQDVAMADIAGPFLKADMDDYIQMKLEGATVDIMCELDPSLKDFISIEKGKRRIL